MEIKKNVIVSLDSSDEENFVIPKNATSIRFDLDSIVFTMPNIKKITVEKGNPIYKVVDGCLINTATKTLVMGIDDATVPADGSVEKIGAYAFNVRSMKTLVIPEGVREIGYMSFASLNANDENASPLFISLPDSVEKISPRAFALNGNITLDARTNSHYYMEGGCLIERATGRFIGSFGKDITVPDCVTVLPDFAFLFEAHETINLSENIAKIGKGAFIGCGKKDFEGNKIPDYVVSAPKNSYAWRYLVRNKIPRRAAQGIVR